MSVILHALEGSVVFSKGLPDNVVAFTTLRNRPDGRGFSFGSRSLGPEGGSANRAWLSLQLGLPITWLEQVHGVEGVILPSLTPTPKADAVSVFEPLQIAAVLTADCLPILLASVDGKACAAIHAGWRGLCNGVIDRTLQTLRCNHQAAYLAWLGPAISQRHFQVGEEVRQAFIERGFPSEAFVLPEVLGQSAEIGKWQADIYALAIFALARLDVAVVGGGERCSYQEEEVFFSHRRCQHRQEADDGRMASVIYLTEAVR